MVPSPCCADLEDERLEALRRARVLREDSADDRASFGSEELREVVELGRLLGPFQPGEQPGDAAFLRLRRFPRVDKVGGFEVWLSR